MVYSVRFTGASASRALPSAPNATTTRSGPPVCASDNTDQSSGSPTSSSNSRWRRFRNLFIGRNTQPENVEEQLNEEQVRKLIDAINMGRPVALGMVARVADTDAGRVAEAIAERKKVDPEKKGLRLVPEVIRDWRGREHERPPAFMRDLEGYTYWILLGKAAMAERAGSGAQSGEQGAEDSR